MACTNNAESTALEDVLLTKWRARMLYQLDRKLHNQLHASTSASQTALTTIERTIIGFYHRSRIKQPPNQLLPLLDIPPLAAFASEKQPIYGDIEQHCNPLPFHKQRETHAHQFATAASSPHHPLPALLQPRPFVLVGRPTNHPSDPTRLLLVDHTASITCHIVHADAALLQRVVLFLRFNLVFPLAANSGGGCAVLEVDGREAVVLDGAEVVDWSVLRPLPLHMMDQAQIHQLFKTASSSSANTTYLSSISSSAPSLSSSASTSSSTSVRSRTTYHLRGHVSSLSPIIQQGAQHFFFVDLRHHHTATVPAGHSPANPSLPSAQSTFLLFQGEVAMCWYHCLHVDEEYLFTHLRPKAVKLSAGRVKLLFAFTVSTSSTVSVPSASVPRVFSASSSELPDFASSPAATSCVAAQSEQELTFCKWTHTVDYVGTITKQVCAGVYELDHNAGNNRSSHPSALASSSTSATKPPQSLRLFLTHYAPIVQDGVLLRPGCIVRLHHVHPLVHSGLFLGFGCCTRSHIAVEQLSPFAEVCKPYDSAGSATLIAQLSRLSLSDAALYLSVMESLLRKCGRSVKADLIGDGHSSNGLIHRLLSTYLHPQHQPNIYTEVMEHASCNSAVPGSDATGGFPTFPSFASLFQSPAVLSAYDSLRHRIHSTDHSSTAWHAATIPFDRLLSAGQFLTGYLFPSSLHFKPYNYTVPATSSSMHSDLLAVPRVPVSSVSTGLQLRESMRDKACAIDCDIRGSISGEHCGVLFHLPAFQLVLETVPPVPSSSSGPLPPIASTATTSPMIVAYLSFSISEAVPLIARIPRAPQSTVFTSQWTHTPVLLHITHKSACIFASPSSNLFLVPHRDLPASCYPSSAASHGHECTLRGLLVSSNVHSPSSVSIHLRPPVLAMSAVVHVGAIVELSSCRPTMSGPSLDVSEVFETTEECTLRVDQSAAASEWQHAMRSYLPSHHSFPQLLTVDMDDWLDSPTARREAFSFCGMIVDKQVRVDGFDQQRRLIRPRRSNSAPQHTLAPHSSAATEPSIPWPLSGKLYLRVRDEQSAHMVDVYVPLGQRIYPAGLLVGAVVTVSGAVRKLSPAWKIYMECDAATDIRMISAPSLQSCSFPSFASSAAFSPPPHRLPTSLLSFFTPCPVVVSQLVHRIRCRIHAVKRLSFAVHCLRCAMPLPPANERRQHKSPCGAGGCKRIEFRSNAYVQIDDGTHTALVVADGEMIWRLLGLTRHEWDEVKRHVGQWGQLLYDMSQHHQQQKHESQQAVKRRREEQEGESELMADDDDTTSERRLGPDEPDIAAMQRERLFTLFRTKPRLRVAVLHCQQLMFAKDIDAFMARRKKQQEVKAIGVPKEAVAQQQCSAEDKALDALLATAVPHEFTVGGVQLMTSKPAGVVMLRALDCEAVDVRAETAMLLRQHVQQQSRESAMEC